MPRALVALGANLGDRQATLRRAIEKIAAEIATSEPKQSSLHETAPVGGPGELAPFLNAAVVFETSLDAETLHARLKQIEQALGRVPGERWGARAVDLDLLLSEDANGSSMVLATPALQVPHPRMAFRRFVLEPAAEAAPEMRHPLLGRTVRELLEHLDRAASYVALLGGSRPRRNELAKAAAERAAGICLLEPEPEVAADSSGPSLAAPLQFLDRAAEALAKQDWASPATVVSAFCLEEYDRPASPKPKLLVLLDDWPAYVAAHRGEFPRPDDARRRLALEIATRGGQVPVLCAGHDDFSLQLNELAAAIVASQ